MHKLLLSFLVATMGAISAAQSFNVDLDVMAGDPVAGNGAPSSSFGGAAGQPGLWNRVNCVTAGPIPLFDTSGSLTGTVLTVTGFGSGGGSNLPINTGDYALLLNDYADIFGSLTYTLTGITLGSYEIYTYAVNASGFTSPVPVHISVTGGIEGVLTVTGPMPGNSFANQITHAVHHSNLMTNTLQIRLEGSAPHAKVNGFQVVAVPEPSATAAAVCAVLLATSRRSTTRRST